MSPDALLLGASAAHAGFSLVVSVVVYPALRDAAAREPGAWVAVHEAHSRRITWVVGPLYLLVLAACGWTVASGPAPLESLAVAGNALALLATALGAAPAHGRLGREGPRPELLERLVWADLLRTGAAVTAGLAALAAY